jgi:hypothetical protein
MRWWRGLLCTRPTRWVIVLVHWNNSPRVDMSLHSGTLFWFWANQSLLVYLNATCLVEKQQISKSCKLCFTLIQRLHLSVINSGANTGGGAPPLKLENIWFFGVKSWFFTRNTPTIFAPPSARRSFFKCAP